MSRTANHPRGSPARTSRAGREIPEELVVGDADDALELTMTCSRRRAGGRARPYSCAGHGR